MRTELPLNPLIVRSHRKTVALIIQPDGTLVVRAPVNFPNHRISNIIREKADWISAKQAEIRQRQTAHQEHQYLPGENFWFLGNQYALKHVQQSSVPLVLSSHFYLDPCFQSQGAQVFEDWYREKARQIFTERANLIADQQNVHFTRLRISSARTRWGSCSSRGTISLVWRLVMAPMPAIDYVILHELVHLKIRNHSKAFWAQIESIMPDYRTHMDWLKEHGSKLVL